MIAEEEGKAQDNRLDNVELIVELAVLYTVTGNKDGIYYMYGLGDQILSKAIKRIGVASYDITPGLALKADMKKRGIAYDFYDELGYNEGMGRSQEEVEKKISCMHGELEVLDSLLSDSQQQELVTILRRVNNYKLHGTLTFINPVTDDEISLTREEATFERTFELVDKGYKEENLYYTLPPRRYDPLLTEPAQLRF